MPDYEVRNITQHERMIHLRGSETLENVLFDVTGGGSLAIKLHDNASVRNVGFRGRNDGAHATFVFGADTNSNTIEHVFCDNANARDGVGINVGNGVTSDITIRRSSMHRFPNNGLYASKADGPILVENCYHTNNRVANFRLGDGTPHIVRNCRSVIDDMSQTELYPDGGGNRTFCYLARHGHVTVENSHAYFDYEWDSALGGGTGDAPGSLTFRDGQVFDTSGDPIGGERDVEIINSGNNPLTAPQPEVPMTPEQAASGVGNGDGPGTTPREWDHEVAVEAPEHVQNATYTIEVTGEVRRMASAESSDEIYEDGGNWFVEGITGNGFGDAFEFNGDPVSFSTDSPDLRLIYDGEEIPHDGFGPDDTPPPPPCDGVTCPPGEECDPATGECVPIEQPPDTDPDSDTPRRAALLAFALGVGGAYVRQRRRR